MLGETLTFRPRTFQPENVAVVCSERNTQWYGRNTYYYFCVNDLRSKAWMVRARGRGGLNFEKNSRLSIILMCSDFKILITITRRPSLQFSVRFHVQRLLYAIQIIDSDNRVSWFWCPLHCDCGRSSKNIRRWMERKWFRSTNRSQHTACIRLRVLFVSFSWNNNNNVVLKKKGDPRNSVVFILRSTRLWRFNLKMSRSCAVNTVKTRIVTLRKRPPANIVRGEVLYFFFLNLHLEQVNKF